MKILSLGVGVQSSTLLLMAERGDIERFDAAIFADVGNEPRAVYEYLEYLRGQTTIPINVVSRGNLGEHILSKLGGTRIGSYAPFFIIDREGTENTTPDRGAMLWRQCTRDYKITVIKREIRRMMEECGEKHCHQSIGISVDEAHRMKESRVRYVTNEYQLVDLRMTRHDCLIWLGRNGYRIPGKSSCIFCPYHSDAFWRDLRDNAHEDWNDAVRFDDALRDGRLAGVSGDCYVHRKMIPLSEVDLSNEEDRGQLELGFGNECEGICGV